MKRFAPATERNREALLAVLREHFPAAGTVLEVASGTGQHAAWLASALPSLQWQPTDIHDRALASIDAWVAEAGCSNVLPARRLDVHQDLWPIQTAHAALCVNMIHIAPWSATEALMRGVSRVLVQGGVFVTYGPYKRDGDHTAQSNRAFDDSLRGRNPAWGVRDLSAVIAQAHAHGLRHERTVEMPANNLSLVFSVGGGAPDPSD